MIGWNGVAAQEEWKPYGVKDECMDAPYVRMYTPCHGHDIIIKWDARLCAVPERTQAVHYPIMIVCSIGRFHRAGLRMVECSSSMRFMIE